MAHHSSHAAGQVRSPSWGPSPAQPRPHEADTAWRLGKVPITTFPTEHWALSRASYQLSPEIWTGILDLHIHRRV